MVTRRTAGIATALCQRNAEEFQKGSRHNNKTKPGNILQTSICVYVYVCGRWEDHATMGNGKETRVDR